MAYLLIAFCFGLSGGIIGKLKGGSFALWFLISGVVPFFGLLAAIAYRFERDEMRRVFNGGLGYVAIVPPGDIAKALEACEGAGCEAWLVGEIVPGTGIAYLEH